MLRTAICALTVIAVFHSPAAGQEPLRWADLDRALVAADSFGFRMNGQQLGLQVITFERVDGALRFEETSTLPQVMQTTEVMIAEPFAMRSVRQRGSVAGREMRIDVDYAGGRATGSALTPAGGGAEVMIDAAVSDGVVDDNVLTALLPAIDWSETTDVTLPVFHSGRNATVEMRLRVTGRETVEVPAGIFETWRVESSGEEAQFVFYVESEAPHRLVRVEVVGAPVEVVRLN